MKTIHVCTVALAIEVEDGQLPEDGVTALLSEQCKEYVPESCLLDWQYEREFVEVEVTDDFGRDSGVPQPAKTPVLHRLSNRRAVKLSSIAGLWVTEAGYLGIAYQGGEMFVKHETQEQAQAELDVLVELTNRGQQ
jgi:hypothetical protein